MSAQIELMFKCFMIVLSCFFFIGKSAMQTTWLHDSKVMQHSETAVLQTTTGHPFSALYQCC